MALAFRDPESIASGGPANVAAIVSASSDLALVVNETGVIVDLSHNLDLPSEIDLKAWRGRTVASVIDPVGLPALDRAMKRARDGGDSERFGLTHRLDGGRELPVRYAALGVSDGGRIVLVGRDLRPVSELQSRLLAQRQSIETTARTHKQTEARYRLLFETASDPIAFVDAETGKVRELNARAGAMLGIASADAAGRKFVTLFDRVYQSAVRALLARVANSGVPASFELDLASGIPVTLAAELFRAGDLNLTMIRFAATGAVISRPETPETPNVEALARNAAEAIVLTDAEGEVIWANEAFLTVSALPLAAQALGRGVDAFFGWSRVERETLFDTLRRHGRAPVFTASIRGGQGGATQVDVSAIAISDGPASGYGFVMRSRESGEPGTSTANSDLARTAENLVAMIGRVPMKDLVRDTTDVIERMCIEAALKLTGNNRASTARVLGLSRQALYLKMHRYGLADSE